MKIKKDNERYNRGKPWISKHEVERCIYDDIIRWMDKLAHKEAKLSSICRGDQSASFSGACKLKM